MNIDEERVTVPERSNRRGSGWLNIVFGIGVIISPFVLGFHSPKAIWNNVITGVVVGVLALIRWSMRQPGWSWLNLILGAWLVISPFVFFLSGAAMWNNVILGIIIAASALTNTYSKVSAEI
ncbi:MAG TPA: SPW repeat protein [Candidatus Udaeobacter sp.]